MRSLAARLLLTLALLTAPMAAPAAHAAVFDANKFAALAIDAETGEILFAHEPDAIRHPASLAKVMTLYIVFDEMAAGRIQPHDRVVISPRAVAQSPTKLGLRAGETLSVQEAIEAVAIRSANDIAVALAEHVSGTEARFAARMTQQALRLGMRDTVFRNASGLPHPRQITTARDMVTLARAIRSTHSERAEVFARTSFTHRGRVIRGHNRLTRSFEGADGLKTGYIRASGFNLISTAARDGRRIVAVVLGGPTGAARDHYMEELLLGSFAVLTSRAQGQDLAVQDFLPLPSFGSTRDFGGRQQGSRDD